MWTETAGPEPQKTQSLPKWRFWKMTLSVFYVHLTIKCHSQKCIWRSKLRWISVDDLGSCAMWHLTGAVGWYQSHMSFDRHFIVR